jgi:hypothetical protein
MKIVLSLYGIPESGTYWYNRYSRYYEVNLSMETSIFDPCLYITKNSEFGLVGMQTDDMLILARKGFIEKENKKLHKANI